MLCRPFKRSMASRTDHLIRSSVRLLRRRLRNETARGKYSSRGLFVFVCELGNRDLQVLCRRGGDPSGIWIAMPLRRQESGRSYFLTNDQSLRWRLLGMPIRFRYLVTVRRATVIPAFFSSSTSFSSL